MVRATPPIWTKHLYSHSIYYFVWKRLFLFCFQISAAAAAKSLQSCPTLCDPIDGSPAGSSVPGILQARTLEWVAISFSSAWKWKVKVKSLRHVRLFTTSWTAAQQAPPSMGISRQEYWSGLPLPSPLAQRASYNSRMPQLLLFKLLRCCQVVEIRNLLSFERDLIFWTLLKFSRAYTLPNMILPKENLSWRILQMEIP